MTWSLTGLSSRSRSLKSLTRSKRASTTATLDPVTETDDPFAAPLPPLPPHDPLVFADPLSFPIADHTVVTAATSVVDPEMCPDSPMIVSSKVSSTSEQADTPLEVDFAQDNVSSLPSAEASTLDSEGETVECKAPTRAPSNPSGATDKKAKPLKLTRQPSSSSTSVAPSVSLEDLVSTLFSSARAANIRTDDPPPSLSGTSNLSNATFSSTTAPDVHAYLPLSMRHDSPLSTHVTHDPTVRRRTTLRSASLSRHHGSTHSVVLVSTTTSDTRDTGACASPLSDTPTTLAHPRSSPPASTRLSSALLDHHPGTSSPSAMVIRAAIDAVDHRAAARCAVLETENLVLRDKVERLEGLAHAHDKALRDLSARVALLLHPSLASEGAAGEVMSLGRHAGQQAAGVLLREAEGAGRLRAESVGSLGLRLEASRSKRDKSSQLAGDTVCVKGFATPRTVCGAMMDVHEDVKEQDEDKGKDVEKTRKKKNRFRSWF